MAKANITLAKAEVESLKVNLDRLTVRAPIAGRVLQLNVRLGQYAAATWKEPMIVLGDVDQYHVRVDIDENDLPWFREGAPAYATLKGRQEPRYPLVPAYVEPYVIPKQSLTGSNSERVDTRVLQAVYRFRDAHPGSVYIGQQMDVYLESAQPADAKRLTTAKTD
ncbi:MAG: HlyD family efflux transporter periplasmic adaptor subunit [Isosphaeraceae bacterium]